MAKFSFPAMLLSILTFLTLASAASMPMPFRMKIVPQDSSSSTTLYLTPSGTITTDPYSAAACWVSYANELFCAKNFGYLATPVGIPAGSSSSVIKACTGECDTKTVDVVQTAGGLGVQWKGKSFWYDADSNAAYVGDAANPVAPKAVPASLVVSFNI
ncbi:hypothetical protein B0J14DRAFT_656071 [Halenospora varia]|nr:hypothetical protein B0J14DRAFT_656071 [Halenospora varia]